MIPKKIFFYWNGETMSWMRYMTLYSFIKLNPDWDVTLYLTNSNLDSKWLSSEKQDYFYYNGINYLNEIDKLNINIKIVDFDKYEIMKQLNPVHQSDMFRYIKLYENGGLYCDMDVLFFRSIDKYYNKIKNSDLLLHQASGFMTIGMLGSSEKMPFFKDIFEFGSSRTINRNDYQSFGVDLIYNKYNTNRGKPQILNKIKNDYIKYNITNLEDYIIYQYDWTKINFNFSHSVGLSGFDNDSIGYHWFGGAEISQKYNNILTPENYMNYKITFTQLIKDIKLI
jgi:hypothetical protein